jgi:hypothetical protein
LLNAEFERFWVYYLSVHQDPWTRRVHALATVVGTSCVMVAFPLTLQAQWLFLGPALGYPIAWFSHLVFEKRPPAAFTHPLWALLCDFRMMRLMMMGKLDEEASRVASLTA